MIAPTKMNAGRSRCIFEANSVRDYQSTRWILLLNKEMDNFYEFDWLLNYYDDSNVIL